MEGNIADNEENGGEKIDDGIENADLENKDITFTSVMNPCDVDNTC